MSTVLVTAGSGFIGTHLCQRLVAMGKQVRVIDKAPPKFSHPNLQFIQGDICSGDLLKTAFSPDVQTVYHLAGLVGVPNTEKQPKSGFRADVEGTLRTVEAARWAIARYKFPIQLIFTSTSAVYGALGKMGIPIAENSALPPPLSLYAEHKQAAEKIILENAGSNRLSACILRLFNVYGHGQGPASHYKGIITIFASQIRAGQPLLLHGGGKQTRDFVSISDVIDACILVMESKKLSAKTIINIGSGIPKTISEVAQFMMEVAGKTVPVELLPALNVDVPHSLADIRRAGENLGWKPKTNFEIGIRRFWENPL